MFETKTRTEVATAEIERYRAARKRVNEIGTSERIGENYWGAVQHCDVIREIAAADVKACFKRISLARAREIVIFCAADQRATIADAAAQLGYRNVQTTETTTAPAIEIGQAYRVGDDLHTVTKAAGNIAGVTVYRTNSNAAKTYALGEFEAMVRDGRAVPLAEAAEPVPTLLAIAGGVNVHWGNDGHTVCGFDGAEQVTNPMYTEPDCHTCWTVWAVTAN